VSEELIAVVEDDETIRSAVAARLEKEGFRVETAADGPAAVALCDKARPDLVVLDVMLPGFDGLEVCRRIQRDRAIPVLMLTALDGETDLLVGLGVGADDYMTKHPDVVFTRDRLMRDVWGYTDIAGARTVDSHIATLRRKLGAGVVRTVHGVGYAFGAAS
jgi:DNA-binding response OmpR family regulator